MGVAAHGAGLGWALSLRTTGEGSWSSIAALTDSRSSDSPTVPCSQPRPDGSDGTRRLVDVQPQFT